MENITLYEDECFISDLGKTANVKMDNETVKLGRYAVIKNHKGQMQVLEVGNDLDFLMEKFGVAKDNLGVVTV